jgi:hypothetical protein
MIREFTTVLASVSPSDGQFNARLFRGWVNTEVMNWYLRSTRKRFGGDYCLFFTDGAGCHLGDDLKVPAGMHIEFLPAYSPELNPAEGLWGHLHEKYMDNQLFSSIAGVENTICDGLQDMATVPDTIRSLTLFDWIKTAILTSD